MILGSIFIEKMMLLAVKTVLPCQCVEKGKILTAKIIDFPMKIMPKITWEMCRKNCNFYFYVTNVFFDEGEHRECMETFLEPYRL